MADIPPYLMEMRAITGMVESPGDADNPQILAMASYIGQRFPEMASYCANYKHDSIPWCGLTVAYCMARVGIRPQFGDGDDVNKFLWAQSWKQFGARVDPANAQPGDVVVFAGHVTLFEEFAGAYVKCRGGNQSDSIKVSSYSRQSIDMIRRAPAPVIDVVPSPPAPPIEDLSAWQSGKGSWYSQYDGKYHWADSGDAPNSAALGCPDDAQGVSFYDHSTLGKWFQVKAPNGKISIEQQTDIGPAPWTGRPIDISAAAAERFGYSPQNFPTNGIFSWRPIDPPAVVAGLAPKDQATRYRDWRKDHSADPGSPAPPPSSSHPEIKIGATGQTVTELQTLLGLDVDGDFGPLTDAAVRKFQSSHGLDADGEVGPLTWAALLAAQPQPAPQIQAATQGPVPMTEPIDMQTADPQPAPTSQLPLPAASTLPLPKLDVLQGLSYIVSGERDKVRTDLKLFLDVFNSKHPDVPIALPAAPAVAPAPTSTPLHQTAAFQLGGAGLALTGILHQLGALDPNMAILGAIVSAGTALLGPSGTIIGTIIMNLARAAWTQAQNTPPAK